MTDMEALFGMIDELSEEERQQLYLYLTTGERPSAQPMPQTERILDLHPGAIWTSDDFDDPLPDEFWLGEE